MTAEHSRRSRNNKLRGKSVEREVAKLVGGQRIPDGVGYGDVQSVDVIYEVKSRQVPTPALIRKAWEQAEQAAAATGKAPAVILCYIDGGRRSMWELRRLK